MSANPFEGVIGSTTRSVNTSSGAFAGAVASTEATPPSTPIPPAIETHYLEPRPNPETRSTLAELHTTEAELFKFRHAGFIVGNTLTEKVVYDLGQVIKRNFVDQKYDLKGEATQPMTDRAAHENELITTAQRLLDKLFFVERLINAEDTPENRTALSDATLAYRAELEAFKNDSDHPLARQLAKAIDTRKGRTMNMDALSFDRTGPNSVGEELQKEVRFLVHCVNSANWLDAKRSENAFSGAVGSAAKQALTTLAKHEFPLTDQPTSSLMFEASPSGRPQKVKLVLDANFIRNTQDVRDLVRMQRFANRLNHGETPSTFSPLGKIQSNPLNPALVWRRRNDMDHPTNKKGKAKFVGSIGLQTGAVLADNVGGLFAGAGQRNFAFFRRRAAKWHYKQEPLMGSPEHREWMLLREITPGKTPLNKVSGAVSELVGLSASAGIYALGALGRDGVSLATNNWPVQKLRKKNDLSPVEAETEILDILSVLQEKIRRTRQASPKVSAGAGAESSDEIEIFPPQAPDVYRTDDLLNLIADIGQKVTSDLNLFMAENPTIALLMTVTIGMTLSPTPVKALLKGLIGELHLKALAEKASSFLPEGTSHDVVEKIILAALLKAAHVTDVSALANFDFSKLLDGSSGPLARPLARILGDSSITRTESLDRILTDSPALQDRQASPPSRVLLEILSTYDHLPSLSQIQKDDLCRALLTLYPNQPEFTDHIIRQCQKTGDITLGPVTLPQSPLSESLTHAVHHVTNALGVVVGGLLLDSATPLFRAQTRTLFEKSGLAVGTALGTLSAATARTVTGALSMVPGAADQAVATIEAFSIKSFEYTPPHTDEDIVKDTVRRAELRNAADQGISTLGQRIKSLFKLDKLQKKHQGRGAVIEASLKAKPVETAISSPIADSSTPITPLGGVSESKTSSSKPTDSRRAFIPRPARTKKPFFNSRKRGNKVSPGLSAPRAKRHPTQDFSNTAATVFFTQHGKQPSASTNEVKLTSILPGSVTPTPHS